MTHLRMNDLVRGRRFERSLRPHRLPGPGGMGAGPWDNFSTAQYSQKCWPQFASESKSGGSSVLAAFQAADRTLSQVQGSLNLISDRLSQFGDAAYDNFEAAQLQNDVANARAEAENLRSQLVSGFRKFSSELSDALAAGNCPLVSPRTGPSAFMADARKVEEVARGLVSGLTARMSSVERSIRMSQAQAQARAQEVAAQEQITAQQIEFEREQAELQFQAEQEAREREYQRQEAIRQQEIEQQRLLAEEQAARLAAERQSEAEERARIQAAEQQRIDAELRKQELAIAAQERQAALEQERLLREEERQIRREEREAEMQRLMLLQELAAKGLPVPFAPTGAAALAPQVPGAPGVFAPGALPGGVPSGYVPPAFAPAPGFPTAPGQPVAAAPPTAPPGYTAIPGYAATAPGGAMPQYAQSAALQPPPGPAPTGFQWAAFDPGAEMFGMGKLMATVNPNLTGSLIEEGYIINGPDPSSGMYEITALGPPARLVGRYTEDQLWSGAIRDGSKVVFVPPAQRPQGLAPTVTRGVFSTLTEGIRAAGQVLTERERRKAERERRKAAQADGGYMGPLPPGALTVTTPAQQSSTGSWVALGALGVGALVLAMASKPKKRRRA